MNKKDRILRYSERVKIEKIILGSLWMIAGASSWINSIWCLILRILSCGTIVYTWVRVSLAKVEAADEMADQNMNKAKAYASDLGSLLSCCAAIFAILFLRNTTVSISLGDLIPDVVFFVMGCNCLITGLAFRKYEDS